MSTICPPTSENDAPDSDSKVPADDKSVSAAANDPQIAGLLHSARDGNLTSIGELLDQYRNYLSVLASTQIDRRLLPRVSPSDVVQETMLRAHKNFAQFRGATEQELLGWLRKILVNNLASFVEQHMMAARRDLRREVSINHMGTSLEESSIRLASFLPDAGKTPSVVVEQREEAVRLADGLAQLPEDYREVLVLRNLQQLAFDEISSRMGRSEGATRMLWLRAIEKLRSVFAGTSDDEN